MNIGLKLTVIAVLTAVSAGCGERSADARAEPAAPAAPEAPAATPAPTAAPAARPETADAPAPTPGRDWFLRVDEDRVRTAILAYETPDTDDQPLGFQCKEGGGGVFPFISGGPADLDSVTLVSGDRSRTVSGATEASDGEPPHFSGARIATDDPFFRAFVANGWLRMTADGETTDMAAGSGGGDAIEAFQAFCD